MELLQRMRYVSRVMLLFIVLTVKPLPVGEALGIALRRLGLPRAKRLVVGCFLRWLFR